MISFTDIISKFVITKAVRDVTTTTAAQFLTEEIILKYGTVKCILTINETHLITEMTNQIFNKLIIVYLYLHLIQLMTNRTLQYKNGFNNNDLVK